MHFRPVLACIDVNFERHSQRINPFHNFGDKFFHMSQLFRGDFKHKFIMDLEKHLCLKARLAKGLVYPYHGHLDEIGSRALKGRVERRALRKLTGRAVFA